MNLRKLYELAVKTGMERDPRGKAEAGRAMAEAKKTYEGLKEDERKYFDLEKLENPYDDTRIINGPDSAGIKCIMAGIDIGEGEIMIADRLREKGRPIDAVISHHPVANALAGLPGVMSIQPGIYASVGVPIGQAESVMEPRIKEVESRVQPVNINRAADAARLLEVPLASFHTVADNCVSTFLTDLFVKEKPRTVGEVMDLIHSIPEYDRGRLESQGPSIVSGGKKASAGNIFVEMTGGTEGAKEMYAKLARFAGVSTIVGMHYSKEHVEAAKAENLNIVIAGHIASDNLGMNLLFDAIFGNTVEVIEASGFRRHSRVKGTRRRKG